MPSLYIFRKTFITRFRRSHYSQFGEDCVLSDWIPKNKRNGFFVDVGCYHPRKLSNTYALYQRGWRGINIDLDSEKIAAFELARKEDTNIVAAVSDVEETLEIYSDRRYSVGATIDGNLAERNRLEKRGSITTSRLGTLIDATAYRDRTIDLLSVDVEGFDVRVLKGLDFERYRPGIILVESHETTINGILASELHNFMSAKNYTLSNWVGYTLFYKPGM